MSAARARLLVLAAALAAASAIANPTPRVDLLARAKAGDSVAMRELAFDLHAGIGGRRDRKGAQRWARAAIDRGDVRAELVLAATLADGERGRLGGAACFWTLSAMHQGLEEAALDAADCLASAAQDRATTARARAWYELALAQGKPEIRLRLFRLYNMSWWRMTDEDKHARTAEARRWLTAAAEADEPRARWMLAEALRGQEPPDLVGAVHWYQRALDSGEFAAAIQLGVLLYEGEGVSDPARAMPILLAAAARGEPRAMRYLGKAYAEGRGVPRDEALARKWFMAGARKKDGESALQRALFHLDPTSGQYSARRARYWLEIAQRRGAAGASRRLAMMHLRGEGTPPDLPEGLRLLTEAAGRGDLEAARLAIGLRLDGELFRRDPRGAINVATRVGEVLDPVSSARIGRLHLKGDGVPRDLFSARVWLTRAAERGDAGAMAAVFPLWADGLGGTPDAELAAKFRAGALAAGRKVDRSWRPQPIDRAAARARGASLGHLRWEADLDWGARDTLEILSLPERGSVRASFHVEHLRIELQKIAEAGLEVSHGVDQTTGVYLRLLPLKNPQSSREVTQAEFVLEQRTGVELTGREVLARGPWTREAKWVEISWDEQGSITVRIEGREPMRFSDGPYRVRSARAVIDSVAAEFHYLVVD